MTDALDPRIEGQIIDNARRGGWTPYQIEILLHHYTSSAPFPRHDARAYGPTLEQLQIEGLLDQKKRITYHGAIFVGNLLRTPLPPK